MSSDFKLSNFECLSSEIVYFLFSLLSLHLLHFFTLKENKNCT